MTRRWWRRWTRNCAADPAPEAGGAPADRRADADRRAPRRGFVLFAGPRGARLAGASTILAVDRAPGKLDVAKAFGATHAVAPEGLAGAVAELTGGDGFDYAFEVVGRSETVRSAWDATRRGGTTVVVGAGSRTDMVSFSVGELFSGERKLLGCLYGSADVRTDFHRVLALWRAGRLDLTGLVSRRITLDGIDDAFAAMDGGDVVRSVIVH